MKRGAMADAFQKQLETDEAAGLSCEDRDRSARRHRVDGPRAARSSNGVLQTAKLRYPATLEAVDFTHLRRLNPNRSSRSVPARGSPNATI